MAHPDDIFHVILDALGELLDQIDRREVAPWEGYDDTGEGDDPKVTIDGYLQTLANAQVFATAVLNLGNGESVTTAGVTEDRSMWVIRSDEGWWSNTQGWVGWLSDATMFTGHEHRTVREPLGDNVQWRQVYTSG